MSLLTYTRAHSQVNFCLRWINETFDMAKPLRRRRTAGMNVETSALNMADLVSPASCGEQGRRPVHELIDMGRVAAAKQQLQLGAKRVQTCTSRCAYDRCVRKEYDEKRCRYRCAQCRDGKGAYYHLHCFFACHTCVDT